MDWKNNEKVSLIKKYFKKEPTLLELTLMDYEGYNLYITLNENRKAGSYRLSWFDLDQLKDKNIDKYLSCEYIDSEIIKLIKDDFLKYEISSKYSDDLLTDKNIVILKANLKTKKDECIDVSFKKYLPNSLAHLADLIIFIFKNMPKKYEGFLFELLAKLTNSVEKYEYKNEFDFDLYDEEDLDKLFSYQIIQRGKKYYEENKIKFLEKVEDRFYAIVEGTEKYLVIIKYNEEERKMQVYCSCPCEFKCKHMYAVILAIRNKEYKRFYKIIYRNPNKSLLERVMDFDYVLCTGVVEQNLEIVNNYGELELVPILDVNGQYNWQVLEDSEDEKLTKQIKYFLDNER